MTEDVRCPRDCKVVQPLRERAAAKIIWDGDIARYY